MSIRLKVFKQFASEHSLNSRHGNDEALGGGIKHNYEDFQDILSFLGRNLKSYLSNSGPKAIQDSALGNPGSDPFYRTSNQHFYSLKSKSLDLSNR